MGRWWRIYHQSGLGALEYKTRRWAQTGEGAILAYRAEKPRRFADQPVLAVPEDEIVREKP